VPLLVYPRLTLIAPMFLMRILLITVFLTLVTAPGLAANCQRVGTSVKCEDGRVGIFTGDGIVWSDGSRTNLSPHPSVILGPNVRIGPGVFVGQGTGMVPLDNPSELPALH
jgi:hypothetical protein